MHENYKRVMSAAFEARVSSAKSDENSWKRLYNGKA
jgi:hypothetical protein